MQLFDLCPYAEMPAGKELENFPFINLPGLYLIYIWCLPQKYNAQEVSKISEYQYHKQNRKIPY